MDFARPKFDRPSGGPEYVPFGGNRALKRFKKSKILLFSTQEKTEDLFYSCLVSRETKLVINLIDSSSGKILLFDNNFIFSLLTPLITIILSKMKCSLSIFFKAIFYPLIINYKKLKMLKNFSNFNF